uniref:Secreted protein n=1 Tax=Pyxicephalus adspersus TaxID=30357 RepID=A0AAV3AAH2_PYXAD|nr:TPA: hypothetical protein GDO54_012297 [Pyxicephalus adspersus]
MTLPPFPYLFFFVLFQPLSEPALRPGSACFKDLLCRGWLLANSEDTAEQTISRDTYFPIIFIMIMASRSPSTPFYIKAFYRQHLFGLIKKVFKKCKRSLTQEKCRVDQVNCR